MSIIPTCSICWDKFTLSSELQATKCGHLFHDECIRRWLESNSSCPECRRNGPYLYRVYLNFNKELKDEKSVSVQTTPITTPEKVERLILKLSQKEEICKKIEKRLENFETEQRRFIKIVKERDREQQKLLKCYQEKVKKLESLLRRESHLREAAETAEEALVEILNSILNIK